MIQSSLQTKMLILVLLLIAAIMLSNTFNGLIDLALSLDGIHVVIDGRSGLSF
ncbi:MAG: hypothetical protein WA902_07645 [Thermosynechococcaceae cyanobacterium]